jgi:hypothetical protein
MTAKELQKRHEKSQQLRVLETNDGNFFVESSKGRVLYRVYGDLTKCSCGDFNRNISKDPNFKCKHILSVMNAVPRKEVESGEFLEKHQSKLDDRFITNIKGKDFVLYAGLLDLAHQRGLLKLEVELVQYPTKENGNEAICRAVAQGKLSEVFSDLGDANPGNCHSMIAKHIIRMASTRAKARVLRDMTNIGMTALEELAVFDEVIGGETPKKPTRRKRTPKAMSKTTKPKVEKKPTAAKKDKPKAEPAKTTKSSAKSEPEESKQESGPPISSAQRRACLNLSRRRGISVSELEQMVQEALRLHRSFRGFPESR